jgi:hypothetical protein
MVWLLSLLLGCSELGHDDFERRIRASQNLSTFHPFTLPVAWAGLRDKDPEIQFRCKTHLNKHAAWVISANMLCQVDYSIFISDKYPSNAAIKARDYDPDTFEALCKASRLLGLHDPNKELFYHKHAEGIVCIVWARSKARRLGLDWTKDEVLAEVIQGTK